MNSESLRGPADRQPEQSTADWLTWIVDLIRTARSTVRRNWQSASSRTFVCSLSLTYAAATRVITNFLSNVRQQAPFVSAIQCFYVPLLLVLGCPAAAVCNNYTKAIVVGSVSMFCFIRVVHDMLCLLLRWSKQQSLCLQTVMTAEKERETRIGSENNKFERRHTKNGKADGDPEI